MKNKLKKKQLTRPSNEKNRKQEKRRIIAAKLTLNFISFVKVFGIIFCLRRKRI